MHVHEKQSSAVSADTAPAKEAAAPPAVETKKEESKFESKDVKKETSATAKTESKENKPNAKKGGNPNQNKSMVGSGASLLNKKARGAKGDQSEWPTYFMHLFFLINILFAVVTDTLNFATRPNCPNCCS